jgi:hypothetical protein
LDGYIQKQFDFDRVLRVNCDTLVVPFTGEEVSVEDTVSDEVVFTGEVIATGEIIE